MAWQGVVVTTQPDPTHDIDAVHPTDSDRPGTIGRTARLQIEPLDLVHARGLFDALDDERVGTYIGGPDVTTLAALRERIVAVRSGPPATDDTGATEEWCNWAVLADGAVVGRVEATLYDTHAEIAYVFGPAWWGQGYATEATRWMIDHLSDERGIHDLWATVAPGNVASAALLGRLGFTEARPGVVPLGSYDDGDLVFRHTDTADGSTLA